MGDFVPQGFADHLADRESAQAGLQFDGSVVESDPIGSRIDLVMRPLGQRRAVVEAEQFGRIVDTNLGKCCGVGPVFDQKDQVVQPAGVLRR